MAGYKPRAQSVRVRIKEDHTSRSLEPAGVRHFHAGEETTLVQVGDTFWDSNDIDGAHIIPSRKVEVIEEQSTVWCKDGNSHDWQTEDAAFGRLARSYCTKCGMVTRG